MKLSQLISFLLSIAMVLSVCAPETQLPNLESGLIDASTSSQTLKITQSLQIQYSYQFITKFTSSPQFAFSLNYFDGNPIGGLGFAINANTSTTGMSITLNTPSPLIKWNQLRFTFIVNIRTDLEVAQNIILNWNPNQKITAIKFIQPINDISSYAARSFLAGVQIPLIVGNLALQVTGLVFNETTFTIGVSSNSIIKSITISYIKFSSSSQAFSAFSGVFAQSLVNGTSYQNAQGSLNSLGYYIYGIVGFDIPKTKFSLGSSLSDTYLLSVSGSAKNVVVSYLSFGINPNKVCEKCNTSFVMYKYACLKACESNMITYNLSNKVQACVMCSEAAGFKNSPSGCICIEGKTFIRGSCIDNTKIQNQNSSSTALQSRFFKDLSETIPQVGATFAVGDSAFALGGSQCSDPNSYFSGNICICRPGFYNINGVCNTCPLGTYYNGNTCINPNTGSPFGVNNNFQTSSNVNGGMPLPLGQYNSQGVNLNFNGNNLGNTPTTVGVESGVPNGALPLGRYLQDGTNLNTLNNGIVGNSSLQNYLSSFYGSSSSSSSSAFGFTNFDDPSYFFPAGMIPRGSSFSQLPQFSFFNNTQICPINEYLSSTSCVCIPGFIRGANGVCILTSSLGMSTFSTSIQSTDYTLLTAPNRTQCNSAYSYVTPDGYCTCQVGYVFNTNFLCFPVPFGMNCAQGSILYSNNTCLCPRNFFNNSGICMTCPPFNYWNGSKCVASCPVNSYYNSTNRNCSCNPGFITTSSNVCSACPVGTTSFNNMCVGCPINSMMVNGQCTCVPGTSFTNGSCVALCPSNTYYDSNLQKCLCVQPNSFVQNNVCVSCPRGSFYDGDTCMPCSGNNYYDPVTRTCQVCTGRSIVVNNRCLSCPEGTTWSITLNKCTCDDISANSPAYCRSIGSGANDNAVCPSSGSVVNGICIICPFNSRFMNGACQCNSGFINDTSSNPRGVCVQVCSSGVLSTQGLCVVCPLNSVWNPTTQSCICNPGFAPSAQGQCVQSCGIGSQSVQGVCQCLNGYYPINGNTANCAICSPGCSRCSSQSVCSECQPSFTFVGTSCIGAAKPISSSASIINPISCSVANCSQCSSSGFNCISCSSGFTLVNPIQCTLTALLISSSSSTTVSSSNTISSSGSGNSNFCFGGCKVYQKCNSFGKCENISPSVSTARSSVGLTIQQLMALQATSSVSSTSSQMISRMGGSGTISISGVKSTITQTSFIATVSPNAKSIGFSFPDLPSNVIPTGSCTRLGSPSLWSCLVNYQTKPISVVYSITLTATSETGNQWQNTFSVDPIKATMN